MNLIISMVKPTVKTLLTVFFVQAFQSQAYTDFAARMEKLSPAEILAATQAFVLNLIAKW